jgi:hypothetical protein
MINLQGRVYLNPSSSRSTFAAMTHHGSVHHPKTTFHFFESLSEVLLNDRCAAAI